MAPYSAQSIAPIALPEPTETIFADAVAVAAPSSDAPLVVSANPIPFAASQSRSQQQKHYLQKQELPGSSLEMLKEQGYTLGLAKSLEQVKQAFPLRIFVIDNSGSMQQNDGHRIVDTYKRGNIRIATCTRWEEIRECMAYHIRLVGLIEAPVSFRLLNHPGAHIGPQEFNLAERSKTFPYNNIYSSLPTTTTSENGEDVKQALSWINRIHPGGCTPLTDHIHAIHREVSAMAADLRSKGQRVSINIFTDGLPSDPWGNGGPQQNRDFVHSLRMLEGLPVWLVIRLCTDDESVVDFYNALDDQLELSIEVLDDFIGEAKEVYDHNPWLNYGLPLHRLRELGYSDRLFDLLDERPLMASELRDFCAILFGQEKMDGIPDPSTNWSGFMKSLSMLLGTESCQWNPITKRMQPWLDLKSLDFLYGDSCGFLPCHPLNLWKGFRVICR